MSSLRSVPSGLVVALLLAACGGGAGSLSPAGSAVAAPSPTARASERPTPSPAVPSEPSEASVSPETTDAGTLEWMEAATFGDEGATLVTAVSAWRGGFVAIGHAWENGDIHGDGAPIVWVSADGRAWSDAEPNFATEDVELRGIMPLATGGVVIVGDIGRQAAQNGQGSITVAAWRSDDGQIWNAIELPNAIATQGTRVTSGPMGHVISTDSEVWYSADAESWQRVYEAAEGTALRQPAAGDEGFVIPAIVDNERASVIASGDGLIWYEAVPLAQLLGVAPWRGDWLAWGYTDDPPTISVLRSANALDWSVGLDVNELTPPDGPKAGLGMESGITEAALSSDGGVAVLTLGWNHCCAQPPVAVGVWTSTDGDAWRPTDLPAAAYVSVVATDGDVVVAGGHLGRGEQAAFWVADR